MATAGPGTSNTTYWLALSLTPGLGPTRARKLVEHFHEPQDVFHASLTELEAMGLQAHSAQAIVLGKSLELATEELSKATSEKVTILTKEDAQWPARLSEIYDPPLVLYVRGEAQVISRPGVAIVGTRHPTPYGMISEFPLGSFPAPQNFPIRNRIISGLSLGVLVVEAGEYSGTRITARCALEQSRELFAVPGHVTSRNSWGPNTLIKQGAKLTATWEDVWEELPADVKHQLESERQSTASDVKPQSGSLFSGEKLSPGEKIVLSLLKEHESTHIDEIIEKLESQLSSSEIFTVLFELELNGKVRQMPGKNFVRSF